MPLFRGLADSFTAVNDDTKLRITGGAEYGARPPGKVQATVMDLEKALGI
jgi:hypothetical protein